MSIDQKEEKEVTLYPNKGSRVEQMLEEAKQVIDGHELLKIMSNILSTKIERGSITRGFCSTTTFNPFIFSM